MRLVDLMIVGLATWRASKMLVEEEGPGRMFFHLRSASGVLHDDLDRSMGKTNDWTPLLCIYCTSLWVAPLALLCNRVPVLGFVLRVLAASALAVVIEDRVGST